MAKSEQVFSKEEKAAMRALAAELFPPGMLK
jgi:hypothetical protein